MEIRSLKADGRVDGRFVVKFKKPVQRYAKGFRFELRVGASDGEVMLKFWGPNDESTVQKLYDSIKRDDVIAVKGLVNEYRDNIEISVNTMEGIRVCAPEEYKDDQFIDSAENIPGLFDELCSYIDSVKNQDLKKVLDAFFSDQDFLEEFKYGTAAMYKHHARIGGLLEHTLSVARLCSRICEHYPKIDRDLAVTGAILHDVGKIREFDMTTNIRTSTEGMLVGHVIIGVEMLHYKIKELGVSEETKLKLKHIILSHHGQLEYGSPKVPAFPEAMLVHCADSMDSSLTQMLDHKENPGTEDDYVYTKDFGNIYLK